MKKIHCEKNLFKLEAESLEDLWYLSQIVEPDDFLSAKTARKVKSGSSEERSANVEKRQIFVTIKVEKIEYNADQLRVLGKITDGPDDIPRGVYQSVEIVPHTFFTIQKEKWMSYHLARLDEACKSSRGQVLVVLMDREEAFFAVLKTQGYEVLSHVEGDVQKKVDQKTLPKDFFAQLVKMISDYCERLKPSSIILASPSFWKDELFAKLADPRLRSIVILATSSSVSVPGLNEVLKRPEVMTALRDDRTARECALVEDLLVKISKGSLVAYGEKEVAQAAALGAVSSLLLSDELIRQKKSEGHFLELQDVIKAVENLKGNVNIISGEHEGGKKLMGLGGIAATLRFRVNP